MRIRKRPGMRKENMNPGEKFEVERRQALGYLRVYPHIFEACTGYADDKVIESPQDRMSLAEKFLETFKVSGQCKKEIESLIADAEESISMAEKEAEKKRQEEEKNRIKEVENAIKEREEEKKKMKAIKEHVERSRMLGLSPTNQEELLSMTASEITAHTKELAKRKAEQDATAKKERENEITVGRKELKKRNKEAEKKISKK